MSAGLLLKHATSDDVGVTIAREARRIQHFTVGMTAILGDLIDVVSIEAGKLHVAPGEHDARALLNEALELFQPLASARQISLATEIAEGSLLASCDHARVEQVLSNLLSNVIKFTKEGGRSCCGPSSPAPWFTSL